MKGIILAAGYATRLYPLTKDFPKALLTIGGRAIMDYICDELDTIDEIDEILVVSNHKFIDHFLSWVEKRSGVKKIEIVDDGSTSEENRLGAIGDIVYVLDSENVQEDVLIIAGDNFFTYSLKGFYDYYKKVRSDCIAVCEIDSIEDLRRMGVVQLDQEGRVADFVEKPENPASNIAVYASYIYCRDTLPLFHTYLQEGNKPDAPGYFPAWLYKRKSIYAYSFEGECYDIGTHESLAEVRRRYEAGL